MAGGRIVYIPYSAIFYPCSAILLFYSKKHFRFLPFNIHPVGKAIICTQGPISREIHSRADFAVRLSYYSFAPLQQADLFIVHPADLIGHPTELINENHSVTLADCFSSIVRCIFL